jgi:acetylornithine/succinyldiaminopimelate/putrescine aminotransferase
MRQIFRREKIGAILVEPVQARGGINVSRRQIFAAAPKTLRRIRRAADSR